MRPPVRSAVELVAVGDELLLGDVDDTNGAWLGRRFAELGVEVRRRTVVGDEEAAITDAVADALGRSGLVVCTGGLGPTRDDVTRAAVAELFGRELVSDPAIVEEIRDRFEALGRRMPETNRAQARVPEGAIVFPNPVGTAPGLGLEDESGRVAVLLPGVPKELRTIFEASVVGWLHGHGVGVAGGLRRRTLRTTGLPESELAARLDAVVEAIAPVSIAFLPSVDGIDLRLTSPLEGPGARRDTMLDAAVRRVLDRLADTGDDVIVYGTDGDDLAARVGRELAERGLTLAVAESCTAGLVAERLTRHPGASTFLLAGIVAYADDAKVRFLEVDPGTLARHGAVSGETVREMLSGARRAIGADAALAVTGVAGPGGGSVTKPVGTVWLAASVGEREAVRRVRFPGDRSDVRSRSAQAVLALLWRLLHERGDER